MVATTQEMLMSKKETYLKLYQTELTPEQQRQFQQIPQQLRQATTLSEANKTVKPMIQVLIHNRSEMVQTQHQNNTPF